MRIELLKTTVSVPSGVTATQRDGVFTLKGPKGEITRRLYHPRLTYAIEGDEVTIASAQATKREKTMLYTMASHLRNMVEGVTKGHSYRLKVCSGHFPMNVTIKGDIFEVKNFIGEAVPRRLKLNTAVKVAIEGDQVTVEAADVEAAGAQAAAIEQLCRRVGFDRRIFQDGIYITHKGEHRV